MKKTLFLVLIIETTYPLGTKESKSTMVNDRQIFSTKAKAEKFAKEQLFLYKQGRNDVEVDEFWEDGGYFLCKDLYSVSACISAHVVR